jgi:hypothetical protein
MARGRRRDEWSRWALWIASYAASQGDKSADPLKIMPADLRPKRPPEKPIAKLSLRQLASAMGQKIEEGDGSRRSQ